MRRSPNVNLQTAMEACAYNDNALTIVRNFYGHYVIAWDRYVPGKEFATRDQVRAAIQAAGGDYFRAGLVLTAAYEERRAASSAQTETTAPEC